MSDNNFSDILTKVDHTNLDACATLEDIKRLCEEAVQCNCASVCVPPIYCEEAKCRIKAISLMHGLTASVPNTKICTVIGFPFGYGGVNSKSAEIKFTAKYADEVDIVINQTAVKNNDFQYVKNEILSLSKYAKSLGIKTVKIIVETCNLTKSEKIELCKICMDCPDVDFIKTSTGYGSSGAMLEDIHLWKSLIEGKNNSLKIKASGGIRTVKDAEKFIEAGADRIGASKVVREALEV